VKIPSIAYTAFYNSTYSNVHGSDLSIVHSGDFLPVMCMSLQCKKRASIRAISIISL